jgi:hypothetical protein
MATNPGIDYGKGLTNIDQETGIRYGVINQGEVLQAWADSSEPDYGPPTCGHCGEELPEEYADMDDREETHCPKCEEIILGTEDMYPESPIAYTYEADGYICQAGDDGDIFVIKSPFYTYAQFCSPCAPGAGYLMDWYKLDNTLKELDLIDQIKKHSDEYKQAAENAGYIRAYCFGHGWYEEVETGKIINCIYCEGKGKRIYPEHSPIHNNGELQTCHNCSGTGKVKEMVNKAPYPVFSVATGELISCD